MLAQRLRQLTRVGVVYRADVEGDRAATYGLTDAGRELVSVVQAMSDWGARWLVPEAGISDVDPDGLMLYIRRHVVLDALPPRRVVIRFDLRRRRERRSYWLVLQQGEVSLCPEHPGFEEDVWIRAEVGALYRSFLGTLGLDDARDDGLIQMDGPPALVRSLPRWFRIH